MNDASDSGVHTEQVSRSSGQTLKKRGNSAANYSEEERLI